MVAADDSQISGHDLARIDVGDLRPALLALLGRHVSLQDVPLALTRRLDLDDEHDVLLATRRERELHGREESVRTGPGLPPRVVQSLSSSVISFSRRRSFSIEIGTTRRSPNRAYTARSTSPRQQ